MSDSLESFISFYLFYSDWKFIVRRVSYAAQRKWTTGGSGRISEVVISEVVKRIEMVLCLNCMCCLYTPARYKFPTATPIPMGVD